MTRNVNLLAKLLSLSALQAEILSFVALSQQNPFFAEVIETIRTTSIDAITKLLAQVLNVREAEIRTAMQPDGQLRDSRVVLIEHNGIGRCLQLEVPVSLRAAMFSRCTFLSSEARAIQRTMRLSYLLVPPLNPSTNLQACQAQIESLVAENQALRAEIQSIRSGCLVTSMASLPTMPMGQDAICCDYNLQSILDHMPAMVGYWDNHLINRFCNYAYHSWLGVASGSILGRHIREVIGEELYQSSLPHIQAVLAGQAQTFEHTITLQSGRGCHSLASYIPDVAHGKIKGFYVLISDITPLKNTEAALRKSEARYRAVVEDQTEVICRFRPDGSLIFVNEVYCRFFGKSEVELLAGDWQPLAHPEDLPLIEEKLASLNQNNPVVNIENRVYLRDGTIRWMHFVNRGFFNEAGVLLEIQSVGRDVTQRKAIEQTLNEAHAQLEQRVAERTEQVRQLAIQLTYAEEQERQIIARDLHDDLGQILHVVKLKLGTLSRQLGLTSSVVDEIDSLVNDASRSVRHLTSQLCPPVLTNLGLVPALRWLADDIAHTYPLRVTCLLDEAPLQISETKRTILFRAARELLINVAKHAKSETAMLELRVADQQLIMIVSDRGRGFAEPLAALTGVQGFGLHSIRERIKFLGGDMKITHGKEIDTSVRLSIPFNQTMLM